MILMSRLEILLVGKCKIHESSYLGKKTTIKSTGKDVITERNTIKPNNEKLLWIRRLLTTLGQKTGWFILPNPGILRARGHNKQGPD